MNNPIPIPKNPAVNPKAINQNLKTRIWKPNEKSGIANDAIPVMATIIISVGLTIPKLRHLQFLLKILLKMEL